MGEARRIEAASRGVEPMKTNGSQSDAAEELEDLPGAFDLDPGQPRVVGCGPGRLPLGSYDLNWQMRRGSNWLVVEPNASMYRGTARFLTVLAIAVPAAAEYIAWRFMAPGDDRLLWSLAMPLPGIALLAGAVFVHWMGRSQAAKGPIFRYSADEGLLHLLRISRTIPRSGMVRLDLISGTWVRDIDSATHPVERHSAGSTELHMVLRLKTGNLVSLPLLGAQGIVRGFRRGLGRCAKALSEVSGVPLERVEESTAFLNPYLRIRQRREQGPCDPIQ
jgi:hypothetical protein